MTWAHDGGRGAYLCDGCRTVVCSGIRVDALLDDAREVRRLSAVFAARPIMRGALFCSPRCAASWGLPANEHRPAFSETRRRCGVELSDATVYDAVVLGSGARAMKHGGRIPRWFDIFWEYRPRDLLRSCERVRDDADLQALLDVAYRLGGLAAAHPLLDEFFGRAP